MKASYKELKRTEQVSLDRFKDRTCYRLQYRLIILLPCVSKIVAFIVKNIDAIFFCMLNWLAIGWLDPSHM